MNEFVLVVKTNSFVHFLGEFEDTKSPFEIIWPLIKIKSESKKYPLVIFTDSNKTIKELSWHCIT